MLETELGEKRGYQTTADKINSRADELEKAAKKRHKEQQIQRTLPAPNPPPLTEPEVSPPESRIERLRLRGLLSEFDYWLDDYDALMSIQPQVSHIPMNAALRAILDQLKEVAAKARAQLEG